VIELKGGFRVEKWERMEDFSSFYPLLCKFLAYVYGSAEKGLKIYEDRYGAISYYKNYRATPNSHLLVLKGPDGSLGGFLYGRKRKVGTYIYDIYVEPALRGRGFGRAMVLALRELSPLPFRADVCSQSLKAFKRWGFKELKSYREEGVEWHLVEALTL